MTDRITATASTWRMTNALWLDSYYRDCTLCVEARIEGTGTWIEQQRLGASFRVEYKGPPAVGTVTRGTDGVELVYDIRSETPFSRTAAAGTYIGVWRSLNEEMTFTLTASGAITGRAAFGCTFSGSFTPNGPVAEATVRFDQDTCRTNQDTVRGVLVVDRQAGKLSMALVDERQQSALIFIGQR